jgi:hypothetical protein
MAGSADTVWGVGDQTAEVSSDQGNAKLVLLGCMNVSESNDTEHFALGDACLPDALLIGWIGYHQDRAARFCGNIQAHERKRRTLDRL